MTLIQVKEHAPKEVSQDVLVEHFRLILSQKLLEDGRGTQAGEFLLRVLAGVDYAGKQGRPVMLKGRKQANGGFALSVSIPVDVGRQRGPAPSFRSNGHGVTREA